MRYLIKGVGKMLWVWLFLISLCSGAAASVSDEVAADFKPLSGYIVMEKDAEYIIDLGTDKGVAVGDLFSVLKPGEKVIHPITKKTLGTLDTMGGILKVTRVKPGFSYARPIGPADNIKRGDVIGRWESLNAVFLDYSGQGKALFFNLRHALPFFKWMDYDSAQAIRPRPFSDKPMRESAIYFILKEAGLEVRNAESRVIHSYSPINLAPSESVPPSQSMFPQPKIAAKTSDSPPKTGYLAEPAEKVPEVKVLFHGYKVLASLKGASVMSDFLRIKDTIYLATTDGNSITLYHISDNMTLESLGRKRGRDKILSVKWWHPSETTSPYLAVTSWVDETVESAIFELQGDSLSPINTYYPYFLGTFDLDGNGTPETLLRQSSDNSGFWGGQVKKVHLKNGKLEASDLGIQIPRRFTVLGSTFADVTGDGHLESIFVRDRILYIYSGRKQLYKSPGGFGGSLSQARYEVIPGLQDALHRFASVEISPVAVDIDGDGRAEVLAVASDKPTFNVPGISQGFKGVRLVVLKYRDNMFATGNIGDELEMPVQGITVIDNRVLFVASQPGSIFRKEGNSNLLSYTLTR